MNTKFQIKKALNTIIEGMKKNNKKIQTISEWEGPIYHRKYEIRLNNSAKVDPLIVMEKFQKNFNLLCPPAVVYFEKTKGHKINLNLGDELLAHLAGPWNSPTRVVEVSETGFKLVTLQGSMEAGHICFYLKKKKGHYYFIVESLAKSKDLLIDAFYDKIPLLQKGQQFMWIYVCEKFAHECCPKQKAKVHVLTEKKRNLSSTYKQVQST